MAWMLPALLGLGLAGAEAGGPAIDACAAAAARPTLSAQLLFGLRQRDGRLVSPRAWRRFLDTRITPRFPEGLTVLSGQGRWRGADGRILSEPSRIVLIVTRHEPGAIAALRAIRAEYAAAFAQDAVGLVLSRSCASF